MALRMEQEQGAQPAAVRWPSPLRLHAAVEIVTEALRLNALWWIFTVAGGVVLGAAPATVAAAHCVRESMSGRDVPMLRTFGTAWRREWLRANASLLPLLLVLGVLGWNYILFTANGPATIMPRWGTLVAFVVVLGIGTWVPAMLVHYDIPARRVLPTATRFSLARPFHTVLQLFVCAAICYATTQLAILLVVVSVGAWLYVSTWLALRTFEENERQRHHRW